MSKQQNDVIKAYNAIESNYVITDISLRIFKTVN